MTSIDLATIDQLTAGKIGMTDVACPICGPERRSTVNQRRRVLRIWRIDPSFATFCCARCGEHGHVRDNRGRDIDPAALARARAKAAARDRKSSAERLSKARWLWSKRRPISGSPAEAYLRDVRAYDGPLPVTLGFLPAHGDHEPAMIAAFGMATEPEPGLLQIADKAVVGVHITRLKPDGTGKAGTNADKIMIGSSAGYPIILAPPNDMLGLAITEGVEDGLSVFDASGLGVWAAARRRACRRLRRQYLTPSRLSPSSATTMTPEGVMRLSLNVFSNANAARCISYFRIGATHEDRRKRYRSHRR